MQQTISENVINNLLDTLSVSCIFCTSNVKILLNMKNSQVTKAFNSLVGTSEAIRLLNRNTHAPLTPIILWPAVSGSSAGSPVAPPITPAAPAAGPGAARGERGGGAARGESAAWGGGAIRQYIPAARSSAPHAHMQPTNKLNEWLAGLIDGDGSFLLSKKGYASLEITMDIRDEHALQIIKNVYGGSIKLRSGANALRYRLHHKAGLLTLIKDVNGHIRNSNRLLQLNKICSKYDLELNYPDKLNYENGWLSGFFDADGSISINKTNTQLSITLSQKTSELLQPLIELYGGNIYIDRGSSQSFKWYITKREGILNLLEYFKTHPSRSEKKNRLHLIPKYYELKDLKANKALSESFLGKSWQYFYNKWLKYENIS